MLLSNFLVLFFSGGFVAPMFQLCAAPLISHMSCNKCQALGVGVIYNPLHVQHGVPEAGQINNRELQQAAFEGSSLEIRGAAPSRLTIDFI